MRCIAVSAVALVFGMLAMPETAAQTRCPVKIGAISSLTGSLGAVGTRIADAARLAVENVNEAGGVKGCPVELVLRDDQGQPSVGVDAANALINLDRVPAIVGTIASGVTGAFLTSVAVPAKVTVSSCCSSAPTFTQLAREGKTEGYFFRTAATSRTLAVASAKVSMDAGAKRIAVIYVNNDYGVSIQREYANAMAKMGGAIVASVSYNPDQPNYRAEVQKALSERPDYLHLLAYPTDGIKIAREWISLGGPQKFHLGSALRSAEFVSGVGARFLAGATGTDLAQADDDATRTFNELWQKRFGTEPNGPGLHQNYDATIAVLLAAHAAPTLDGTGIRDQMRRVVQPGAIEVRPGPEGLRTALQTLGRGEPVRYVGAIGPFTYDQFGDVTGSALVFGVNGEGQLTREAIIPPAEIGRLFALVDGR